MPKSKRSAIWIALLLLCQLSESSDIHAGQAKTGHLEGGYCVQLPSNLDIAKVNNMPDFTIYSVTDTAAKQLLVIYIGNFPDNKIKGPHSAISSSAKIGGFKATLERWRGNDRKFNGSTLIRLTGSENWPKFAHLLFRDLSRRDSDIVEGIVNSFHKEQVPGER
jgi:hypothetical protein